MSTATKIGWTRSDDGSAGATWNPVTGCTKLSGGCDNCYAETFARKSFHARITEHLAP